MLTMADQLLPYSQEYRDLMKAYRDFQSLKREEIEKLSDKIRKLHGLINKREKKIRSLRVSIARLREAHSARVAKYERNSESIVRKLEWYAHEARKCGNAHARNRYEGKVEGYRSELAKLNALFEKDLEDIRKKRSALDEELAKANGGGAAPGGDNAEQPAPEGENAE